MTRDETSPEEVFAAGGPLPAAPARTRPFYWSVRREIWEHRAVYIAPLAAAGVGLLGALISVFRLPHALRAGIDAHARSVDAAEMPFDLVAFAVLVTGLLFAFFYCVSALHNERRDRSLLFWKSLPVSDLTTVLSKAAIPLVVVPVVIFTVIFTTHLIVIFLDLLVLGGSGINPALLFSRTPLPFIWFALARGLILLSLWYAPVCAWLIMVSAWAKRMPVLWAVGPLLAICMFERLAFGKHAIPFLLRHRLGGGFDEAFTLNGSWKTPVQHLADLNPLPFLANPAVWLGLILAALFLAAAVRLRRSADPI